MNKTVAHNLVAKLSVAFVAVAMLFTIATPAKAATADEMQQMITDLLAQVAALQGQMGSNTSAMCPYTWTRSLTMGATGADVMKLQQFLNTDPATTVAVSGAGSVGMETQYYGPATAAAVSKFQVKHALVAVGTGYFGPLSMAKANSLCSTAPTPTPGDDNDDDDDDSNSGDLSGEASLDTFEVSDGEDADDVEEGDEDMQVAEFQVNFEDGDAMITRLDIALVADGANDGDVDPWDNFEEVSIWVDGDEVARKDVTDEDEYLDEDDGTLRFSGLDIRANDDEEVTVVVAVSTQSNLDGVGAGDDEDWEVTATSMRFIDADDVTTTEDDFGDLDGQGNGVAAEFSISEEGAGDELDLESSDEDPDATTFSLDEDENTEEAIFAFDLSADDSDGDIDLNEITVTATVTTASNVDDLVNDFRLEIDGQSFDAESYVGSGMVASITFDIDGDVTVAADETLTAVLFADFEDLESGDEGSTIVAEVEAADIDAEATEDVAVGGSDQVVGETHTVRTVGVDAEVTDSSVDLKENGDSGTADDEGVYIIEFDVTAFGEDLYIDDTAASGTVENNTGVNYLVTSGGSAVVVGTKVPTLDSDAELTGGRFVVRDGETESFTLTVEYDPETTGSYKVQLYSVNFNESNADANQQQVLAPAEDYDTASLTI